MKLFVLPLLLFILSESALGLLCGVPRCTNEPKENDCHYGLVPNVCGECNACAKGPGEECGGIRFRKGKCTQGYECVRSTRNIQDTVFSDDRFFNEGTCQQVKADYLRNSGTSHSFIYSSVYIFNHLILYAFTYLL